MGETFTIVNFLKDKNFGYAYSPVTNESDGGRPTKPMYTGTPAQIEAARRHDTTLRLLESGGVFLHSRYFYRGLPLKHIVSLEPPSDWYSDEHWGRFELLHGQRWDDITVEFVDNVDWLAAATARVDNTPEFQPYRYVLLEYDWNSPEHLPWVALAPDDEILTWCCEVDQEQSE
jgi:hypothetical protein